MSKHKLLGIVGLVLMVAIAAALWFMVAHPYLVNRATIKKLTPKATSSKVNATPTINVIPQSVSNYKAITDRVKSKNWADLLPLALAYGRDEKNPPPQRIGAYAYCVLANTKLSTSGDLCKQEGSKLVANYSDAKERDFMTKQFEALSNGQPPPIQQDENKALMNG